MSEATPTPESGAPTPASDPNPTPVETQPDGFKSEESKQAVLADLKKEREERQALAKQIADLQAAQKQQTDALAQALGLAEPPKTGDDLAETVNSLKAQFEASQREATRLRIAAEKNIPAEYHDLLTETDTEKLKAQAEKVAALVAAQSATQQPPAFQANPGQGRGGNPDPSAAEDAEYERYYPTPNRK